MFIYIPGPGPRSLGCGPPHGILSHETPPLRNRHLGHLGWTINVSHVIVRMDDVTSGSGGCVSIWRFIVHLIVVRVLAPAPVTTRPSAFVQGAQSRRRCTMVTRFGSDVTSAMLLALVAASCYNIPVGCQESWERDLDRYGDPRGGESPPGGGGAVEVYVVGMWRLCALYTPTWSSGEPGILPALDWLCQTETSQIIRMPCMSFISSITNVKTNFLMPKYNWIHMI